MSSVAIAMVCKTPIVGQSKTRLSPPLAVADCALLSACFISDVASAIQSVCAEGRATGYAVYSPAGSGAALGALLPEGFSLIPQGEGGLGERLTRATEELLGRGHGGVILVNSDSPTLPGAILREAVDAVRGGDRVVIGPALDGGYTLIGLSAPHPQIFAGIPWSTGEVYRTTAGRAREIKLPVVNVSQWYDVDDEPSLRMLEAELAGRPPAFATPALTGGDAPMTRKFLAARRAALASATS
jgi:rSAM/selenodomain-associated transferase 1